jgi:general secretion pathway protein K
MRQPSRGVALITALLVVAIAALASTALLASASLSIHRMTALRDSEQGWWVARGVESWVLGILDKDRKDNGFDGLGEDWAQPVDYLPVDYGYVRGNVVDLSGRFNLNNLVLAEKGKPAADVYRKQFERLVAALPAELQVPPGLVNAILDWADADQEAGFPGGAEDSAYLAASPPYRTADRPFTVVSELLAIQGMTPPLYEALRGRVCTLPTLTKVNVNTAPEEVLRALSAAPPDEARFRQFLERRRDEPVETEAAIASQTGLILDKDTTGTVTVRTPYFQIQGEVFVGSSRVALYSLIHRPESGMPTVLAHAADAE